jgi:hypothetical protein
VEISREKSCSESFGQPREWWPLEGLFLEPDLLRIFGEDGTLFDGLDKKRRCRKMWLEELFEFRSFLASLWIAVEYSSSFNKTPGALSVGFLSGKLRRILRGKQRLGSIRVWGNFRPLHPRKSYLHLKI